MLMRINPERSAKEAIAEIERTVTKYSDGEPFTFQFMDDAYSLKFANEERVGQLAGIFTSLAIFISCLGIFGLSSFTAEQRTKEIGIRKVHGASILELWRMMSKEFIILVIVSCAIATPIAYQLLSSWLMSYEYRVDVTWTVFIYAAISTIVITLVTISWHTIQAAQANPIKSLRSE
jgi:ABC-type antimicrobial peptide transport system permease subunit